MSMIFVPGTPAPQGSARGFPRKGGGVIITHDNPNTMPWRYLIHSHLAAHYPRIANGRILHPRPAAIRLEVEFVMPRRVREPKATPPHTRKPDRDKLLRAVGDALTGKVYDDDSQVTCGYTSKRTAEIGEQPGVHVSWWVA